MYIVSMGGGLGNQMFEYAFYKHLKTLYPKIEIKVDKNYAFPLAHNGIEVFNIFGLDAPEASINEVKKLVKYFPIYFNNTLTNRIITKVLRKINKLPKTFVIQKDFTAFYDDFLKLSNSESKYFYGPFANYRYFEGIKDDIKRLYKFPDINDEKNKRYESQIRETNSVSIHIRRGDYIREGIQLVSDEFYIKAINYIKEKVKETKFFVFTDDKDYCKDLFNKDDFIIVEGNTGSNSYKDMQLMSLCKHNIIANSTFSFWGAFLNANPEKIVIAPNLVFTGCSCKFTCPEWLTF